MPRGPWGRKPQQQVTTQGTAGTATPTAPTPFPEQFPGKEGFLEGPGEGLKKGFYQRLPTLPPWAEFLGYTGGQDFFNLMQGPQGLTGFEQQAAGAAQGLLAPQPPGGTAFAGIADALAPYLTAERERGLGAMEESLSAAGMFRSGAGQQLLGDYQANTGMNIAAALAPFAMQGQQLQQQGVLAGIPYLGGFGQTEFQRPYDVLSQYMPSFLSSMSGQTVPREPSAGFLDYAIPLASAAIGAGPPMWS